MENKSTHILSTSSNLLGFSFIVFTSVKAIGLPQANLIDAILALLIIVLAFSCLTSFLSIRSTVPARSERYELYADYLFLLSLLLIIGVVIFTSFDYLFFVT